MKKRISARIGIYECEQLQITYRALKNQADLKPGESIDERIRGWKAIHSLTHDPIERLCHHELLDFLRDDKGEV